VQINLMCFHQPQTSGNLGFGALRCDVPASVCWAAGLPEASVFVLGICEWPLLVLTEQWKGSLCLESERPGQVCVVSASFCLPCLQVPGCLDTLLQCLSLQTTGGKAIHVCSWYLWKSVPSAGSFQGSCFSLPCSLYTPLVPNLILGDYLVQHLGQETHFSNRGWKNHCCQPLCLSTRMPSLQGWDIPYLCTPLKRLTALSTSRGQPLCRADNCKTCRKTHERDPCPGEAKTSYTWCQKHKPQKGK
jgi:hypothetical protein